MLNLPPSTGDGRVHLSKLVFIFSQGWGVKSSFRLPGSSAVLACIVRTAAGELYSQVRTRFRRLLV